MKVPTCRCANAYSTHAKQPQTKYDAETAVAFETLEKVGTMWFCLTCISYQTPAAFKSFITSLPGELSLAPHAPSPGWHAFFDYLHYYSVDLATTFSLAALLKQLNVPNRLTQLHASIYQDDTSPSSCSLTRTP